MGAGRRESDTIHQTRPVSGLPVPRSGFRTAYKLVFRLPFLFHLLYHYRVSSLQILIAVLATSTGALLQGVTGLGLNLVAAPILIMVQPRLVPGPILAGAMLLNVLMALRDHTGIDLRGVGWMAGGMLPGALLASQLLPVIPYKTLALILGGLVLAGVLLSLAGLRFPPKRWVLLLAGFVSGLGGTLVSVGGPPVALVNQDMQPNKLRATLSGYFLLAGLTSLAALVPAGRMGAVEAGLAFWLFPGVTLGFLLSSLLVHRLHGSTTRYILLALSALSALVLIFQQLLG
jgi:uncharacterized membrane protein YfcA